MAKMKLSIGELVECKPGTLVYYELNEANNGQNKY